MPIPGLAVSMLTSGEHTIISDSESDNFAANAMEMQSLLQFFVEKNKLASNFTCLNRTSE